MAEGSGLQPPQKKAKTVQKHATLMPVSRASTADCSSLNSEDLEYDQDDMDKALQKCFLGNALFCFIMSLLSSNGNHDSW